MQKEIKLVQVGNGIGVRIPNELAKSYKLKKGEVITLKPEDDGIKLVMAAWNVVHKKSMAKSDLLIEEIKKTITPKDIRDFEKLIEGHRKLLIAIGKL